MTTYNILTIGTSSAPKLAGKFNIADTENFLDRLEETLYILFELEPKSANGDANFSNIFQRILPITFAKIPALKSKATTLSFMKNKGGNVLIFFSNFFQKTVDKSRIYGIIRV